MKRVRFLLYIFIVYILFSATLSAQSALVFDKKDVECENMWVAVGLEEGGSVYGYGFIYIDRHAGLTFHYEGKFTISSDGVFVPQRLGSVSRIRLMERYINVMRIPENKFVELNIETLPAWFDIHRMEEGSLDRLFQLGFLHNVRRECETAIIYLEEILNRNPDYKGVVPELAFSYNELKQYDKAISVLEKALEKTSKDAYLYKELIYAQLKAGLLEKASESFINAVAMCEDQRYHGENSYNLVYEYFFKKDKANFEKWLPEAKKWNAHDEEMMNSLRAMEKEINN